MCTRSSWGGVTDTLPDTNNAHPHSSQSPTGSVTVPDADIDTGNDKFVELQQISSSLQFQALFALLDKR